MKELEFYKDREQTYIKHFFLENYLETVAYHILYYQPSFIYVDGFSGPWKSQDENFEDTSFAIAIRKLLAVKEGLKKKNRHREVRCLFIEKRKRSFSQLRKYLEKIDGIETNAICTSFEESIPQVCEAAQNSFSFCFIDPSGWTGFSLKKITPLLKLRGEVIINFMSSHIDRFDRTTHPKLMASFDNLFGNKKWQKEVQKKAKQGLTSIDALAWYYKEAIKKAGDFDHTTYTTIMNPSKEKIHFNLIYGTRHLKGLMEFRRIEKKVINIQDQTRKKTRAVKRQEQTNQGDLFDPETVPLAFGPEYYLEPRRIKLEIVKQKIWNLILERKQLRFEDILAATLEDSYVYESDVKAFLKTLTTQNKIKILGMRRHERTPKLGHIIQLTQ